MLARICTLLVLSIVTTGCASHCDEVAALRHAFDTRTATTEPHIAIMHVAGSWRVKLGVWLKQLGAGPMRFAQKHAASWKLSVADREREVELVGAVMRGDSPCQHGIRPVLRARRPA